MTDSAPAQRGPSEAPPAITWSWSHALRCGLCTIPAGIVAATSDPVHGVAWAVGVIPAAILGLAPTRTARLRLIVAGILFAVSVCIGSLLSHNSVVAVAGIFLVALGAALLASRRAFGAVAMALCAPVAAIGLSYSDFSKAFGLGLIMICGSTVAALLFMLWPEDPTAAASPPHPLLPPARARLYGVCSGLAAATATAIGIAVHTDHVGWAPAAALLVMRPNEEMQMLRSVGRIVSVALGALAAVAFLRATPSDLAVGLLCVVVLAGAGGTRGSRWYVTPFFTTFLVLTMLLYADATVANEQWRFSERVVETVLGVGLAYLFGLVLPQLLGRSARRSQPV